MRFAESVSRDPVSEARYNLEIEGVEFLLDGSWVEAITLKKK